MVAAVSTPKRVDAAIRAWAVENGRTVAPTGRMPTEPREAWLEATDGVVPDRRAVRCNLGQTEALEVTRRGDPRYMRPSRIAA